ncbi:hypothetical protein BG46_02965 [Brucella anthropi]|nr:hypothetical protein BG46_02965 [Brucella anthropi]PQZ66704.1 hypothetical protein CQ057_09415 [Ochrobactrum sp. MYb49]
MKGETMPPARNHRIAVSSAGFRPVFSTRILFRKPLRTFRDAVCFNAHLIPKTASHFSGCAIISPSDDSLFKKVPIS